MAVLLYAGSQRFRSAAEGRRTWHSFSFGEHYDPANVGFGPLTCLNDDHLDPGAGYPDHPHADVEIVTWVLSGALRHTDSADPGRTRVLERGAVQVQSAGSGIRHSEVAERGAGPTRFVQTWLRPDDPGTPPGDAVTTLEPAHGLTTVVGGTALSIGVAGASLAVGSLPAGEELVLPDAPRVHVLVVEGSLVLPGRSAVEAVAGDAVRVVGGAGSLRAGTPSRVLVWALPER
jgi:redox-sensitive bicupin YhaK (pirin superfamily)